MTTGGGDIQAKSQRLEAVVLAAGAGTRFGGGKLLAPWAGGVLLDGALGAAFAAPVRAVTVVWGADAAVAEAAKAFAQRRGEAGRLRLVHADRYAEGLSASLIAAMRSMPRDATAVFVFLGDMPRVPTAVLGPLAEALSDGAAAAAPVFGGQRGHPVLFSTALSPDLMTLERDRGAAAVIAALGDRLALVPAPDDGVLFDVDQPEDLHG